MQNNNTRRKSDNKQIIKKIILWVIQIAIIVIVTNYIPNQYAAIAVAIVLGIVASKILSLIIKDTEAGKELETSDPNEEMAKNIIQSWSFIPEFLREKLVSLEKGQIQDEFSKIELRKYKQIVEQYLTAVKAKDDNEIDQARTLLDYIKVSTEGKYPEIFSEASYLRNQI